MRPKVVRARAEIGFERGRHLAWYHAALPRTRPSRATNAPEGAPVPAPVLAAPERVVVAIRAEGETIGLAMVTATAIDLPLLDPAAYLILPTPEG